MVDVFWVLFFLLGENRYVFFIILNYSRSFLVNFFLELLCIFCSVWNIGFVFERILSVRDGLVICFESEV